MRLRQWPLAAAFLALFGCGFHDVVDHGVPNLVQFAPGMWRMGQPANADAWKYLGTRIAPNGQRPVIVKLNDDAEGDDSPAEALGWTVVKVPLPPEDDKPWTVLVEPHRVDVERAVGAILLAHFRGQVVAWHCVHGRDRTSLVSAIVGMRLLGWSKSQAWDDMIRHGFRWELPDLDAYWLDDVH